MTASLRSVATCLALLLSINCYAEGFVHQWVELSVDDSISGRIVIPGSYGSAVAVKNTEIQLIPLEDFQLGRRTQSDDEGVFVFQNVTLGEYAIIAQADNAFACGVLHVVRSESTATVSEVEIPAAMIDRVTVRTAITRYLTAGWKNTLQPGLPEQSRSAMGTPLRVAVTNGGFRGRLMKDGWRPAEESNVFVFQEGREVARTISDSDGWFQIDSIEPGKYSVLAIGPDGLGATGIQLIDTLAMKNAQPMSDRERVLILQAQAAAPSLAIQLVPPAAIDALSDDTDDSANTLAEEPLVPENIDDLASGYMPTTGDPLTACRGGGGFQQISGGGTGVGDVPALFQAAIGLGLLFADDGGSPASPPSPIVP